VVLDIGGGSPMTGMGFFSALLATAVKRIIVMDPNISPTAMAPANVEFVRRRATYEELRGLLTVRPELTHVVSVSVFEHIQQPGREEIVRAINDFFPGQTFVATFEYHAKTQFFRYNLTAQATSHLFRPLTKFYPDQFHASPVWSEDAFDHTRMLRFCYKSLKKVFAHADVPRWYPVAVRFVRS
jgi:2-polyprenyl-3-methyl-5-hydroxy-6-metoxy-1,4-benzoquinol methylase